MGSQTTRSKPEGSAAEPMTEFLNNIMEEVFVCLMEPKHIAGVCAVEHLSFAVPWTERMFTDELVNPLSRYVVLLDRENPGNVIAYAGYWKIFDEGHITNVAVHPHWRGRKAATYLMQQLMQLAASEGLSAMTLEVRRSNMAAQGLYTKLGFAVEGVRTKYYEDNNEDALIMWYRAKEEQNERQEEVDANDHAECS